MVTDSRNSYRYPASFPFNEGYHNRITPRDPEVVVIYAQKTEMRYSSITKTKTAPKGGLVPTHGADYNNH